MGTNALVISSVLNTGFQALNQSRAYRAEAGQKAYQTNYNEQISAIEEKRFREQSEKTIGQAVAASGASGFDVAIGSGISPVNALIRQRELDASAIRQRAKLEKYKSRQEQMALNTGAQMSAFGGGLSLLTAGYSAFAGTGNQSKNTFNYSW